MWKKNVPKRFQERVEKLMEFGMPKSLIPNHVKMWEKQEEIDRQRPGWLAEIHGLLEDLPTEAETSEMTTPAREELCGGPEKIGPSHYKNGGWSSGDYETHYYATEPKGAFSFYDLVSPIEWGWCRKCGYLSTHDLSEAAEDGDELARAIINVARRIVYRDYMKVTCMPQAPEGARVHTIEVWMKK